MLHRTGLGFGLWLAAAAACLAQCHFPPGGTGRTLTYTFHPSVTATGTVLHVILRFRGGADGQEEIEVPTEWAGETLHGVVNLHVVSANRSPTSKIVRYRPGDEVVLTYDVVKDWSGRFRHPAEFHGAIMPEYIEVNGSNALVHPALSQEAQVTAHFDWTKLPAGWVLATSFGTSANADGRCQSYSGAWSAVEEALFAAGEFRIRHFRIGRQPAVLAARGAWTFSDDEAIAEIQKAVGAVRDFWHDDNFPYYLVTLKAFDEDSGDEDGSEFTNAFWMYLSRRDSISSQIPTLIHETFHAWNPRRMGSLSGDDSHAIEWFREGFTTYYGYLLALRAHLIQLPAYVESINRDLRDLPGSTNPYVRGRVIALWLDRQIRRDSADRNSLDNVMYDMVSGAAKPLNEARILETAGRYLSPASRTELARAVAPGSRIPAVADALGTCVHGSEVEIPTFDLGFDFAASTAAGKVTGVEPGGPAFRAGLRNGQRLTGRYSVYWNHPEKTAFVGVQGPDGPQAIEYYPRGAPVKVMQYHLDEQAYAAKPASCQTK